MRAAFYEGPRTIHVRDTADPVPGDGELVIQVKACGLCGTDMRSYKHGHDRLQPPRILGHEFAGVVIEKGSSVHDWNVGDRVGVPPIVFCGECPVCRQGVFNLCPHQEIIGFHRDGGFSEYVLIPERAVRAQSVSRIPDHVTFVQATLAEPMGCVINSQELGRIQPGDVFLGIGAGPLGIIQAELAKDAGASMVIVVEEGEARRRAAASFRSVDVVIDPAEQDVTAEVRRLTDGRGADVVMIVRASPRVQAAALDWVAPRGRIVLFGGLPKGGSHVLLDTNIIHYKEAAVVGATGCTPRQYRRALDILASGAIDTDRLITHRFKLENIADAFEQKLFGAGLKAVIEP